MFWKDEREKPDHHFSKWGLQNPLKKVIQVIHHSVVLKNVVTVRSNSKNSRPICRKDVLYLAAFTALNVLQRIIEII